MKVSNEVYNRLLNKAIKPNKYGNKKTLYNEIKFDSIKEEDRYKQLRLLEKANLIKELELQKTFELQPSFKYEDKTYRRITYIVDFYYYDNKLHKYVAEDVKGFATDVYKIKKKMFMYKYSDIVFKEVR